MSKITEKLDRILSICEPVMTADRMQNVSIEVRDIKTILEINANKTMAELLEAVESDKKYIVVYFAPRDKKMYLDEEGNKVVFENWAKIYDNIYEAGNAITRFSAKFPNSKFYISEKKEPCKKKQEMINKMHELISKGENIPTDTFKEWNEFVENC